MKTIAFILSLFLIACSTNKSEMAVENVEEEVSSDVEYPTFNFDTLRGSYQGSFGDKELNLTISHVSPFNAVGYNVVGGLIRNVTGKVEQNADSIILNLAESGEHEHDGIFRVAFHRDNLSCKGTWTPYKSSIKSKSFKLTRQIELDYSKDINYEVAVTNDNFLYFFTYATDSLGSIHLTADGLAVYEHESDANNEKDVKHLKANGSWTYKNNLLTILWQPNLYFPKLKSTFKLVDDRSKEDGWLTLQGEGRVFYSSYERYF